MNTVDEIKEAIKKNKKRLAKELQESKELIFLIKKSITTSLSDEEKNKVKILFMGQDGTHIAEAAGRPATAGFGGRAQDFANYFGVNEGAAFINACSFTIKGQYGVYNTPYIYTKNGKISYRNTRTKNLKRFRQFLLLHWF